jgi:hypothetical protein
MPKYFITFVFAGTLLLFAGCGRSDSDIQTYKVAKEDSSAKPPIMSAASREETRPALPRLHWELPKGWVEQPAGEMRSAAFQITGKDGQTGQVTIIPLPGAGQKELESVNMWRESLGLEALTSQQMTEQSESVDVDGVKGRLFDMAAAAPKTGEKLKTRLLGAIADRGNILWFIKMIGDDALVAEQKPVFVSFLKSLSFEDASPQMVAAAERPISTNTKKLPPGADAPKWKVPANWQEKAPGPMITALYAVTGENGAADVSISKFPGDVGGMLANVNRWRGQLGLPAVSEQELGNAAQMVEIGGKKDAYEVDIKGVNARSGKPARLVAIAVPRENETWFYKLLGDEAVVEKEKSTFQQFVAGAY